MSSPRLNLAVVISALAAVALAAGLEGGVEVRLGAAALGVALLACFLTILGGELPVPGRWVKACLVGLVALLVLQTIPLPHVVRELVAPGATARVDRLAGELVADKAGWLSALTVFDVEVLLGGTDALPYDVLAGAKDLGFRSLLADPSRWAWQAGQWATYGLLVLVGWRLGRQRETLLPFLIGMIVLAVFEAFFGFANRNGPSTGIGEKVQYLGSATGTFINRGHLAAFLNLGLGALWGLAASLFPLLPEEVRKHHARKRRSSQPPGVLEGSGDKLPRLTLLTFLTALLFVGLVASQSRGPLLSLVAAGLLVGLWTRFRRDDGVHLGLGVAAPLAGVVFAALTLGPRGALGRFASLGSGDVSVTARLGLWRASLGAWLESPIFGYGPGGWRGVFAPHEAGAHLYDSYHAHSEPVELGVELGAVGLLLLGALGFFFFRTAARRLDVVDHDLRSSVAVGALVAIVAVMLQCGADFPLRTPGVAVPFALFLGIALSALDSAPSTGGRAPAVALWGFAALAVGWAGIADARAPGDRWARLSEAAPVELLVRPNTGEEASISMVGACDAARRSPLDAWRQMACALAAGRVAQRQGTADEALVADVATVRALSLHPKDPRLAIYAAQVWQLLGEPTSLPNAFDERATQALMLAVRLDGWRAEEAFRVARRLPTASLDRIGQSASDEPVSRARTLYQYGIVVEEHGNAAAAADLQEEAALADPQFGPPAFRAGLLAGRAGDAAAAERWYRLFLAARDRPVTMEGWVLFNLGEVDAAEVRFRRAVAVSSTARWAWEGLASVAAAHQDTADELEAWRHVLSITPDHAQARRRTRELGAAP
ncbi:hypothetical protein LBMAG42_47190 [Deltaproteobacteria bacterium]|nr:hypothetical protein LBMAG42_47190 [Deltaproteobacteria bacterium]